MDKKTKRARDYLKSIPTVQEFMTLVGSMMLSDLERQLLVKFYLERKNMSLIATELGYSIQYVKLLHRAILSKIDIYLGGSLPYPISIDDL